MTNSLAQIIQKADHWRGSSPARQLGGMQVPFKEWQHFVIFGENWVLVFNLNLDAALSDNRHGAKARVITILSDEQWSGEVHKCDEPEIRRGAIDARFADAGMRWRDGAYEIWQHGSGVTLEITLKPASIPSLTHNIPLGAGSHLSWCLLPRLSASGWVRVDGKKVSFQELGAYHDHNWGRFHWGGNFSWEWGCAFPSQTHNPWTLVFARMNSKDRNATTATSAFLVHRGRHLRYFRNAEVELTASAKRDSRIAGRIPNSAALLLPDEDRDVPESTIVNASKGADWLNAEIVNDPWTGFGSQRAGLLQGSSVK